MSAPENNDEKYIIKIDGGEYVKAVGMVIEGIMSILESEDAEQETKRAALTAFHDLALQKIHVSNCSLTQDNRIVNRYGE